MLLDRRLFFVLLIACIGSTLSFSLTTAPLHATRAQQPLSSTALFSSASVTSNDAIDAASVQRIKADLVRACQQSPSDSKKSQIQKLVQQLCTAAEQVGMGQASASSGYLSGTWELLYSAQDATRSSPFFWAFEQAFPDQSTQIFSITDAIPAPLKEVGPAFQEIDWNDSTQSGRFVSRVKVATLGGAATSIMTTRASMVGTVGLDGVTLAIETTKPEKSTIVSLLLGPLGDVVNENAPAFPSGEALEQVRPGSSRVVMRTPFCDESLRVSFNDNADGDVLVWKRQEFASYDFL